MAHVAAYELGGAGSAIGVVRAAAPVDEREELVARERHPQFPEIYKERHVFATGRAIGRTIDYRLRPLVATLAEGRWRRSGLRISRTSSRICGSRGSPADGRNRARFRRRINRTIEIMRHMGCRPRVPRSHALPSWTGDADSKAARRQQTSPANLGRRGSTTPCGRAPTSTLDADHGARHGHAPGKCSRCGSATSTSPAD